MDVSTENKENNPGSVSCVKNDSILSNTSQVEFSSRAPTIEDFTLEKPVSRGAFGKVFLGYKKSCPEKIYAIKVMKKADMINKNLVNQVIAERDAMASTFCPFIVRLFYSLQSQQNIYLIMEYLIGGDVKSLLTVYGYFDEDMAVLYAAEIILALSYLHKRGIIHRDIKPDNMLISGCGHIKLTDFGLSKISLKPDMSCKDSLKTPGGQLMWSQHDYRTPGQILSLASSLAFSVPKSRKQFRSSDASSNCSRGLQSMTGRSPCLKGRTPKGSLTKKVVCARDNDSRHSVVNQMTPPVKSLTPTLQDSMNWLNSTTSEPHTGASKGIGICTTSVQNLSNLRTVSQMSLGEDEVFKGEQSGPYRSLKLSSDKVRFLFSNLKSHQVEVISSPHCHSHLKASAKQETMTDNTPQLHRSNESLWTSYAARNLRSMRDGSYSEENDEIEGFLNSPLPPTKNAFIAHARGDLMTTPRCSSRTSNKSGCGYTYLSDDEDEINQTPGSRKRVFAQVDHCEERHTGMTGVFDLLQVEEGRGAKKRIISMGENPHPVDMVMESPASFPICESPMLVDRDLLDDSSSLYVKPDSCFQTPLPPVRSKHCETPYSSRVLAEMSPPHRKDDTSPPDCKNDSVSFISKEDDCLCLSKSHVSVCQGHEETSPPGETNSIQDNGHQRSETTDKSRENELDAGGRDNPAPPSTIQKRTRFCSQHHSKSLSAVVAITPDMSVRSKISNFWTPAGACKKTPFRTPKSIRRGVIDEDKRILGTPDYLAPELLLKQGHGPGVDWWALGVCLFEFLTGVPPFCDNSPELIFQNILSRDIPWPEEEESLSEDAQQAINALLTFDPKLRPTAKGLKSLSLFEDVDWDNILQIEPPFVPQPDDQRDTSYFQARNLEQHLKVSAVDP